MPDRKKSENFALFFTFLYKTRSADGVDENWLCPFFKGAAYSVIILIWPNPAEIYNHDALYPEFT